jgi:DNA (cytosine-5)-methyltransferase 1
MGKLKVASLFCGCGGMDRGMQGGFEYLGKWYSKSPLQTVYAVDNDKFACDIFSANFPVGCVNSDVKDISSAEIPPHHILTGGFPCQSFSVIAQNPPRLGYKDENGRLFFEMCRILKERKPICFVAENVKGLLSANKRQAFPLVMDAFREASYHAAYAVLNAADYGVPQKRERVFIVGFRDPEMLEHFRFPQPVTANAKIPLSRVILSEDKVPDKYYFSEKAVRGLKRAKKEMNKGRVQDPDGPCNTVGAHLAKISLNGTDPVLKINGRYRMFTPREAARIQSFPEDFVLVGADNRQWRAVGNAVPPVLMWHITKEVIKAIKKTGNKWLGAEPFRTPGEIRSYNMSQIRSKDTVIEIALRRALSGRGHRYRTHYKGAPGKPDIAFTPVKLAVFCDSAFWHGRDFEQTVSRIKTHREYWEAKIKKNMERDREVNAALEKEGWGVLRFWDEDIKNNIDKVVETVETEVAMRKSSLSMQQPRQTLLPHYAPTQQ